MKRLICRAKRKDTKEWIQGYYWQELDGTHYIGSDEGETWDGQGMRSLVEVDPETVGQFTGRVDMDNARLFEGDVADVEDIECGWAFGGDRLVIAWAPSDAAFKFMDKEGEYYHFCSSHRIKLIGNIHDHPDMLENGWEVAVDGLVQP